jgi:hypothetical protein
VIDVDTDVDALSTTGAVITWGLRRERDEGGRTRATTAAIADVARRRDLGAVEDSVAVLVDADVDPLSTVRAVRAGGFGRDRDQGGFAGSARGTGGTCGASLPDPEKR